LKSAQRRFRRFAWGAVRSDRSTRQLSRLGDSTRDGAMAGAQGE